MPVMVEISCSNGKYYIDQKLTPSGPFRELKQGSIIGPFNAYEDVVAFLYTTHVYKKLTTEFLRNSMEDSNAGE